MVATRRRNARVANLGERTDRGDGASHGLVSEVAVFAGPTLGPIVPLVVNSKTRWTLSNSIQRQIVIG